MSTNATPTLATKLAAVYPNLKIGTDYGLNKTGDAIGFWKPFRGDIPTLAGVDAAYPQALAAQQRTENIAAAEVALVKFWESLTPEQQEPLLDQWIILRPLSDHTAAKMIRVGKLEAAITGLTPAQEALKAAAIVACSAVTV